MALALSCSLRMCSCSASWSRAWLRTLLGCHGLSCKNLCVLGSWWGGCIPSVHVPPLDYIPSPAKACWVVLVTTCPRTPCIYFVVATHHQHGINVPNPQYPLSHTSFSTTCVWLHNATTPTIVYYTTHCMHVQSVSPPYNIQTHGTCPTWYVLPSLSKHQHHRKGMQPFAHRAHALKISPENIHNTHKTKQQCFRSAIALHIAHRHAQATRSAAESPFPSTHEMPLAPPFTQPLT